LIERLFPRETCGALDVDVRVVPGHFPEHSVSGRAEQRRESLEIRRVEIDGVSLIVG
jgi:hypothetical protein